MMKPLIYLYSWTAVGLVVLIASHHPKAFAFVPQQPTRRAIERRRKAIAIDREFAAVAAGSGSALALSASTSSSMPPSMDPASAEGMMRPAAADTDPLPVERVALLHVLLDVCRFRPDSAIVGYCRRGDFRSVDELCDLTDDNVSDLVASAESDYAAAVSGADIGQGRDGFQGSLGARQVVEVRLVQLLRLWRAHLYKTTGAVPTDEDWLRFTAKDFEEFSIEAGSIPPPTLEESHRRQWLIWKRKVARDFVDSIMSNQPVPIEGSGGMFVMNNTFCIEAGQPGLLVVLPRRLRQFWQACLDAVDAHDRDPRKNRCSVVAVGTSGVGKTACTPYLIKMLLERGKTAVYHVRSTRGHEAVYEFIPTPGRGNGADAVMANAYPSSSMFDIPSLRDPDTYYIVDPSKYKGSCDMDSTFRPKIIIVAEPDERLWGASEFFKGRGGVWGRRKYFPLWELDELLYARPFLSPNMTDEQVKDRYEQVGGIPSHVLEDDDFFRYILDRQRRALMLLESDPFELERLAYPDRLPVFDDSRPSNCLIGYDVDPADDGTFSKLLVRITATRAVNDALDNAMGQAWPLLQRAASREAKAREMIERAAAKRRPKRQIPRTGSDRSL